MTKKIISVILCLFLVLGAFSACSLDTSKEKKLTVVTTIFPIYDWVINVLGDKAESYNVKLLADNGADLHNFQPTADDIMTVGSCDLFVYVGGESDEWVGDVLKQSINKDMIAVNLMEVIGENALDEEIVEGMEHDDHDEDHSEEHEEDEHEHESDEHIWLSLENAEICVKAISSKLCSIDAENAQSFSTNTEAYCNKLNDLDASYETAIKGLPRDTILVADRFPFRYLFDDYDLKYFAAFSGCSAESEASFETISFLASKADELNLDYVVILEGSNEKIATTVINQSSSKKAQIIKLDSMQTLTLADITAGKTYLSVMEKNLEVMKTALG